MKNVYTARKAYQKQIKRVNMVNKILLPWAILNGIAAIGNIAIHSNLLGIFVWISMAGWAVGEATWFVMHRKQKQLYKEYMEVVELEYARRGGNL